MRRTVWHRALTVALSLMLALSTLIAGMPFYFCHGRDAAEISPCCGHALEKAETQRYADREVRVAHGAHESADVSPTACCEHRRVVSGLPGVGAMRATLDVLRAVCTGRVPIEIAFADPTPGMARRFSDQLLPAREGPAPPLIALHRTYRN